jgi:type II secretory pathway component PulF
MRQVVGELVYPFFLVHFATLVLPVRLLVGLVLNGELMAFLLPKVIFLGVLYAGVGFFLFAGQGQRAESWRARVESLLAWVPLLGVARRNLAMARLAAALEALLNAGVNTIEAWELAATASGSPALRRTIYAWRPLIESGVPPSELMTSSPEFPEIFSHMYTTAEHSGKIDQTLVHLHAQFRENGMQQLKLFTRGMLIGVSLIVAISIAIQIISFYVGYFNQITTLSE